ncbi:Transcriptional regulator, TetR family OS=Tsukamurella paurometabola (strain ATCC 8368 / DSM/ CCUG 35730 / CIP 100753 / JCM 10117 / KCTC 9821 / NBRC 16120/ NCIMB 702349 / NCTC 13040) OX=521096 GN=Tpau_1957 PE=4 SV=1 [Tsukamurella paurometabola]|uniref:Transcriptional regulator, TetR family n=1 Tax=Tsukamurella paurometabola (strain ATCC 8368 / DSM 20162 / CCUG 35730 / CIP 100753 / JCM 10117 / KCTC 9821 / NBRC 16120 / NCIMB 702349 / NCTC 13040) TaxID=521096 RepID=D5UNK1_TSUPD|nr:TetR/AcrR family transcriptional regulator [Tsukamurella paurometabola]ADG78569.1 transcriptional regulator, TetR family [Tsukamurella paurometabola DSM 20162]SUP32226.1 Bacterial regulatory proteins, tetR family [Tsukamurella paurometabola]
MMSQDLNEEVAAPARTPANAIDDQTILDAARDLMTTIGIRRTTMADVARAAQVSRATLYRRYPNVQALAATVTTREFSAALATLTPVPGDDTRESLARTVVHLTSSARSHPLLRRIIELDPEFLIPYLLHRQGRTSANQLDTLEAAVRAGQNDGSIRSGDPRELASVVLQAAWSSALSGPVFAGADGGDLLDSQLFDLVERYLRP